LEKGRYTTVARANERPYPTTLLLIDFYREPALVTKEVRSMKDVETGTLSLVKIRRITGAAH